jgi:hypothetical protein
MNRTTWLQDRRMQKFRDVLSRAESRPVGFGPALVAPDEAASRCVGQRLRKSGLRFSMKAAMPSFWSSSANIEWNSRFSKRSPSASVVS